jgi:hypothetical protein
LTTCPLSSVKVSYRLSTAWPSLGGEVIHLILMAS